MIGQKLLQLALSLACIDETISLVICWNICIARQILASQNIPLSSTMVLGRNHWCRSWSLVLQGQREMRKDLYHPTWNNLRIVSAQCCNYCSKKTSLPTILQVALWAILCLFVITSFSNQTLNWQLNSTCSVPMILIHSTNRASLIQRAFFKLELNSSLAVQLPLGSNWA